MCGRPGGGALTLDPPRPWYQEELLWREGKGASKDYSDLFLQVWLGKWGERWSDVIETRWKVTVTVATVEDSGALAAVGE